METVVGMCVVYGGDVVCGWVGVVDRRVSVGFW